MGQADEVELVRSARLREHRTLHTPRGCAKDIQCYLDIYIYTYIYIYMGINNEQVCSQSIHISYINIHIPTGAFVCHSDKIPHGPTLLTHLQPGSSNGSELYSCLSSRSRDRGCAGNILVESSSPQPQDTGAVQLTHLRFGLKSVGIMFDNVGILLVQL